MTSTNAVVHVTIERFFEAFHHRKLDDLVTLTDEVDGTLNRHASGWERPSADEAVLVAETPWGSSTPPMDWAGALRDDVRDSLGLDCSVGIAGTRVAARICSRMARPRGVLLWLQGYEDGLISALPLEELDELRPEQLAQLRARGIRTLGEMSCLAPAEARALLGSQAPMLLSLVRGLDSFPDTNGGGRLGRAVGLLAQRLARRLVKLGKQARGLELRFFFEDGVSRERYTLLPRSTASFDVLRPAAQRLLEMSPRREEPVVGLSLTATGITVGGGQLSLFRNAVPREVSVKLGRI